jgi:tetratricopeptide (TPR) repeat protein
MWSRVFGLRRLGGAATLLACAALLSGCAVWRQSFDEGAPGLQGRAAPTQALDPQLRQTLDLHFKQGAAALARNDLDATLAAWRQYVALAPPHLSQARQLRGYLTLLSRESARRFARQAVAREQARTPVASDRLHIALFAQPGATPAAGRPGVASFNRALMAMISTDLARVPALTVLEREKIDALLQEQQLSASGLVETATALAQARLLGAGTIVAGAVHNEAGPSGPGSGRYRIHTVVSDVAAGRVQGLQEADGLQAEFFVLQKRIVYGILDTLGITDLPPAVHKVHTRSWQAYARFGAGLQLLAENRFSEAQQALVEALKFDPDFALAQEALLATPDKAVTLDEMRAAVQAGR